ncbi:MAG: DUF2478 domain-containing protein [Parahaliea sp.]
MKLAYVTVQGRGRIDQLLAQAAEGLQAAGVVLAGTVQTNIERDDRRLCDMDLQLLPNGPVVRISVDRGPEARGCRLDAGVLEDSVLWLSQNLDGAQLLIVNKFGIQEASGRGLVPVIAEALSRNLPVLVGVNGLNLPRFLDFAADLAELLEPEPEAVIRWGLAARQESTGRG